MGKLSNDGGDSNKNGKKAIGLDEQNNNYACASPFFVFLGSHFMTAIWNLLILRAHFT